jgi:hypothetical protein
MPGLFCSLMHESFTLRGRRCVVQLQHSESTRGCLGLFACAATKWLAGAWEKP